MIRCSLSSVTRNRPSGKISSTIPSIVSSSSFAKPLSFRRGRLSPERHFLQQRFDPRQSLVTLNGEMEGLTLQLVMLGVQESDDWPWLAKVAPRTSKDIALPPRLLRREPRGAIVPAKGLGLTTASIGRGTVDGRRRFQVTDPGRERLAPSASRVKRICSAYSRAN